MADTALDTPNRQASAKAFLDRFDVRCAQDIRLEEFALHLGARVISAPLDGAEAQLVRTDARSTIILSDRIVDPSARRFNLAHELGHLVLAHPSPSVTDLACSPKGWTKSRGLEHEASAWGSEVLMPGHLVGPLCDGAPANLDVPRRIASAYTVALAASAIRFTELTTERCAAVYCVDGKVKWCARSKGFRKRIKRGTPVHHSSVAADFFASGELDERPQPVRAEAWLKVAKKAADVELAEHAVAFPKDNATLSMLWISEPAASDVGMRT
jgi:Zn-dependent peptidase ImmA (M78 family)